VTDASLEGRGRKRRVVLSVPHFLFVPEVVARTDLVAMLPVRLVKDRPEPLQIFATAAADSRLRHGNDLS
jgi:hypothetical protein